MTHIQDEAEMAKIRQWLAMATDQSPLQFLQPKELVTGCWNTPTSSRGWAARKASCSGCKACQAGENLSWPDFYMNTCLPRAVGQCSIGSNIPPPQQHTPPRQLPLLP
ncbi:hypothetical protein CDV31_015181 [Fusarium ambrosium]|uniref:Uncharacterized protein n=1 Tax=Fusarium ambrosium TaxID=131363 RepID=A0A428SRJ4_9HYPO|nr:hypothetical protein CDV31_015181 [Fusarium ambrosium]